MTKILVFTDGACTNNGKKYAKAGYGVHFPNNDYEDVSEPFLIKPITNQRAELYAIYQALNIISNENGKINERIDLYTDSQYSIDCLTKWIKSWEKNGWKVKGGKPVKNLDIIKPTYRYIKQNPLKVFLHHVKSHTGKTDFESVHNDVADKLATSGLNKKNESSTNLDKLEKSIDQTDKQAFDALEESIRKTNKIVNLKKISTVDYKDVNFKNFYKQEKEKEIKNLYHTKFYFKDFDQLSQKKPKNLFLNFDKNCKHDKIKIDTNKKKKTLADFFLVKQA